MKRGRLEEARVLGEANGSGWEEPCCQSTSQSLKSMVASTPPKNLLQRDLVQRQNVAINGMPVPLCNANVFEAQLISAFWECYIPKECSAQTDSPCVWLQQSICLPNPPPALRLSLKALAMTRLGWLHRNDVFVRQGRVVYGHALRELQKMICDERSLCQDETLATCNVLAIYEVSISTIHVVRCSHSIRAAFRVDTSLNHWVQ